jgi:putative endonuclease
MTDGAYLYILRCSDGSYYVGTTRSTLEGRISQHNAGTFGGYTASRRPVTLIFSQWFDRVTDAIESERKLKKWSHSGQHGSAKGSIEARISPSFETPACAGLLRMRLSVPQPRGRASQDQGRVCGKNRFHDSFMSKGRLAAINRNPGNTSMPSHV